MSIFKGSFWKKLPGILQRIAELIMVASHSAPAAAPAAGLAPGGQLQVAAAGFSTEALRVSWAKLPAFLLAALGAARLVGQFTGAFHVPPGAEGQLQGAVDATTAAIHAALGAWDAVMALLVGLGFIGVRTALPGGAPLTRGAGITIETFGTVQDAGGAG